MGSVLATVFCLVFAFGIGYIRVGLDTLNKITSTEAQTVAMTVYVREGDNRTLKELMDASLPEDVEKEIVALAMSVDGVRNVHELKTRRNGISIIIEAHMVVDPNITVVKAHDIVTAVEDVLRRRYGDGTQISIHIEPSEQAQ